MNNDIKYRQQQFRRIQEILTDLKYEPVPNMNKNCQLWIPTKYTPSVPWRKTRMEEDSVLLPLLLEASDFDRLFLHAIVQLHNLFSWCNRDTTELAFEYYSFYKQ